MIQHLLHSKVSKAESYLIGDYHNERLELTYHIETLIWILLEECVDSLSKMNLTHKMFLSDLELFWLFQGKFRGGTECCQNVLI